MAKETGDVESELTTAELKRRLEVLDQRLDNIDSVVTAVVERVMSQPVTVSVTCPHCGKTVEFALIGKERPK